MSLDAELKRPSYLDRIKTAKTAFLSIPTYHKANREAVLQMVRSRFPQMTIHAFDCVFQHAQFPRWQDWRIGFSEYISGCDLLIVACDSTRLVTSGVRNEIDMARRKGKDVMIFKTDDKDWRRYFGYERLKSGGRLYKKAEGMEVQARLKTGRKNGASAALKSQNCDLCGSPLIGEQHFHNECADYENFRASLG